MNARQGEGGKLRGRWPLAQGCSTSSAGKTGRTHVPQPVPERVSPSSSASSSRGAMAPGVRAAQTTGETRGPTSPLPPNHFQPSSLVSTSLLPLAPLCLPSGGRLPCPCPSDARPSFHCLAKPARPQQTCSLTAAFPRCIFLPRFPYRRPLTHLCPLQNRVLLGQTDALDPHAAGTCSQQEVETSVGFS